MAQISQKYQKDYKNVSFKNPRLKKEKEIKKIKLVRFMQVLVGLFVVAGFFFLFFSPFFKIDTINVEGLNNISAERFNEIINDYKQERVALIFSRQHMFFFSEKKLREKIGESYLLDTIDVTRTWPRTIIITVTEKDARIVWLTQNNCYNLDDQGFAIALCDAESVDLIRIKDAKNEAVTIGQQVTSPEMVLYLFGAQERLKLELHPTLFIVNFESVDGIKVETGEGFAIYMNKTLPADEQIDRLYILIGSDEVKSKLETIRYFDLRFGEKLYYQ